MLSRNNFSEKLRKTEDRKQRFSIRKFSVGAASVLIGLTLFGFGTQTVKADTDVPNSESIEKENKEDNQLSGKKNISDSQNDKGGVPAPYLPIN